MEGRPSKRQQCPRTQNPEPRTQNPIRSVYSVPSVVKLFPPTQARESDPRSFDGKIEFSSPSMSAALPLWFLFPQTQSRIRQIRQIRGSSLFSKTQAFH